MPSAVIAGYAYDTEQQTLEIRYHSGKVYQYLNVPEKVFKESARRWSRAYGSTGTLKGNTV